MNSIRSRVAKLENVHHGKRERRVGVIYVPLDATDDQIAEAEEAAGIDRQVGDGVIIHRMPGELLERAPWQTNRAQT